MNDFCVNITSNNDNDIVLSKGMAIFAVLILFIFSFILNVCCVCCFVGNPTNNRRRTMSSTVILES